MTFDPRISKLPKWARDEFDKAQRNAALSLPTFERPSPDFTTDTGGAWLLARPKEGTVLYSTIRSRMPDLVVSDVVSRGGSLQKAGGRSYTPVGRRKYFIDRDCAILDAWWDECERAGSRLYLLKKKYLEARG